MFSDSVGYWYVDDDTIKLPLIVENVFTLNPPSGLRAAVNEPVKILLKSKSKIASAGMSNKFLPEPE